MSRVKLTLKAERFSMYYPIAPSGRAAAIQAGYSVKSAATMAGQLLRKPHIKERIEYYRKKYDVEIDMSLAEAIQIIQQIARKTGDYKEKASNKESLQAAITIAKIKGAPGLTDKVVVITDPFVGWTEEDFEYYDRTGKTPKGRHAPEIPKIKGLGETL